jgi:hypothetical protein
LEDTLLGKILSVVKGTTKRTIGSSDEKSIEIHHQRGKID